VALMREQLRGVAPYISVFGLILLVAGLVVRVLPSVPANIGWGLLVAGLVLLVAWPVLAWSDFKAILASRRVRFGGNALVLAVAILLGLVAVYFLGTRFYWTQDLTTNKQFTLQRQTLQILDNLKAANKAIQLTAVLGVNESAQTEADLRRLVERYTKVDPQITITVVRPDQNPTGLLALAGRLKKDPNQLVRTLTAESGGQNATVYSFDEQGVSEAVIKATRGKQTTVYFTTGHGEPGTTGDNGYGALKRELEGQGDKVETVSLATMTQTLKAGDLVIVAGATRPFPATETKTLSEFLKNKGSLLIMTGTPFAFPPGTPPDLGLDAVLAPWQMKLGNDLVLDPAGDQMLRRPTWALVQGDGWQFDTITKDLTTTRAAFPDSRSVSVGTSVTTSLTSQALVKTGAAAWAETDLQSVQANQMQPSATEKGPVTLGTKAEGGKDYGRVVVFGSSQMATDGFLNATAMAGFSNGGLVLNAINWLTADEDLISIQPTSPENRQLSPPQNPALLWWFIVVILPLLVLGVGVWVWWQRR
jgi:hypothetical protein